MQPEVRPAPAAASLAPLATIVLAELLGASIWFTPNGVADQLARAWGITAVEVGYLTSAVQLGFIAGTLAFALSGLADRFRASRLFCVSALFGAVANALLVASAGHLSAAVAARFVTGLALAGVYPVGMKLVIGWAPEHRGVALGWLLGMLALGTALPHLLRGIGGALDWQWPVLTASALAVVAGLAVLKLGDGPHTVATAALRWGAVFRAFHEPGFRAAAFGYFGHMWELYAVWTIVPFLLAGLAAANGWPAAVVPWLSFVFIASGALGCIAGGHWSRQAGHARVAITALATSGAVCIVYPWATGLPSAVVMGLLLVWGIAVVADSPQFSALASTTAPPDSVGSALALMNSIGFLITVASIELVTTSWSSWQTHVTWLLAPGPVIGVALLARWLSGARTR